MRQEISIHAPRTGSDAQWYDTIQDCIISIHAPRTGSDAQNADVIHLLTISIHAPRTGSDTTPRMRSTTTRHFNPRSPHGERRAASSVREVRPLFQSTLPARGATLQANLASGHRYISIHAPRTGSDVVEVYNVVAHNQISIHAPRTGSDRCAKLCLCNQHHFNPRSPHGERLKDFLRKKQQVDISIHAPRTGSDLFFDLAFRYMEISIHAPRTGSDENALTVKL